MSHSSDSPTAPPADGLPVALRHAVSLLSDNRPASGPTAHGQDAEPRREAPSGHAVKGQGGAVKVQIVEDLPRVQQLLRQLVEQAGRFEVTAVDDSEQAALGRLGDAVPDALVVDLNLRQGSGLGLINAVRRQHGPSPAGPLIIVVTNHTMPILQAACMKAGADHFLDKSRELTRLPALLKQAFER